MRAAVKGQEWMIGGVLLVGVFFASGPARAHSQAPPLAYVVRDTPAIGVIRVLRVERVAGARVALAEVQEAWKDLPPRGRVTILLERLRASDLPVSARSGERLLVFLAAWPEQPAPGLKDPAGVKRAAATRWGRGVRPFTLIQKRQVWRIAGEEWIRTPSFAVPTGIRTRGAGSEFWVSLRDLQRRVNSLATKDTKKGGEPRS